MFLRFELTIITVFVACISLPSLMKAQSFVNEANRWTYTLLSLRPHNNIDSVTYEARFDGTVQIDNRQYHEAFERKVLNENSEWKSLEFFYRQEGAKVFLWDKFYNKERLLYDFALDSIGATFAFPNDWVMFGNDLILEVIDIDSITLKNGELRKRQTFNVFSPPRDVFTTYWIEGIGSEDTPLFPFSLLDEDYDGGNRKLECFFTNEEHLLQQNPEGECAYLIVDVDDIPYPPKRIKIFPNPAKKGGPIFFSRDLHQEFSDLQVSIYNSLGQLVLETTTRSPETILVDHDFDTGIYYCIIKSKGDRFYTNFILID